MVTSGAKILSLALCFVLVAVTMPLEIEGQATPAPVYSGQDAPFNRRRPARIGRAHRPVSAASASSVRQRLAPDPDRNKSHAHPLNKVR